MVLAALIVSLILNINIILASHSRQLTNSNFETSISTGSWFVEHYSPSCTHCIAFEPTWNSLVEEFGPSENENDFHFGQIDCSADRNLCENNGIKSTPTLVLFQNGILVDTYAGSRALKDLSTYVKAHLITKPLSVVQAESPNPHGKVRELSEDNFESFIGKQGDGNKIFIKFFAPWCPHCQHLAPVWEDLARRFKDQLEIASVDCEQHPKLCKSQNIGSYPTLAFYSNTHKKVYRSGRSLEKMKQFAEKSLESGIRDITIDEFEKTAPKDEVFYLFLHSKLSSTNIDLDLLNKARNSIIGGPTIYRSRDDSLFDKYSVDPNEGSVILAFKESDYSTPLSIIKLSEIGTLSDELNETKFESQVKELASWLKTNSLPLIVDASIIFNELLNTDEDIYLVILPIDLKDEKIELAKNRLKEISRAWLKGGRSMKGQVVGDGTIFAYIDSIKYGRWLKSMYSFVNSEKSSLDYYQVIISNPNSLEYFDKNINGQITSLNGHSIFSTLEGIYQGTLRPKSSQNAFEYTVQAIHNRLVSYKGAFWENIFKFSLILIISVTAIGVIIYTLTSSVPESNDDSLHLFSTGTRSRLGGNARDYYPSMKNNRRID